MKDLKKMSYYPEDLQKVPHGKEKYKKGVILRRKIRSATKRRCETIPREMYIFTNTV